ncbi:hypothetical protein OG413_45230 [Streptomyces sp. NBC_01433]|uniref:hypothetical protein n=1 Tax=Streptomyces sp. NBC_01433 TaxID=2903864 RepID=UPI00224E65FC|nr:hypothetical protein [Streptomyces sp. NBC_01433]MCX4681313.1 hypothetical protein [Streptomyces sp. NBC_01433]MCX4681748.1 hypothetical protein [Streptomyces sp. NBC_01433]MCX4682390.1 hypothetical protein [Streptomyces sp. NBC_01433]
MDHTAHAPVAVVGSAPAAQPWRRRIRRVAAVPVLAAGVLVAVVVAADWALSGSAAFRGWLFSPWAGLVAVAVVVRGHRLVRRACTAVGRPLPGLLRHGAYPEELEAARVGEEQDVAELDRALHVRMFAVIDLYPRSAAAELIAALRRAVDSTEPLPTELRAALDDLADGSRRWHDTLA